MDADAGEGTHCSLNHLGTIAIGGVQRAENITHTEPITGADDGTEVAGILNAVEGED